jgi:hypothetical protein
VSEVPSLDHADNPVWVFESPDEGDVPPPVEMRDQELPFERLSWQNFERLCLRLARTDGDVERCRLFGTQGQEQGGIDIYVSRKSTPKYAVWQSKRHKSFTAAKVEKAVAEFLDGEWGAKSDHFVLCVQANLRSKNVLKKVETCAKKLAEMGVQFELIDGEELSLRLKDFHEIVDDFFGRQWVTRFCGAAAAQTLLNRLRPGEMTRLKADLRACYASHFAAVDPGVIAQLPNPDGTRISIGLADRYVPPDLWLQQEIVALPVAEQGSHPAQPVVLIPLPMPKTQVQHLLAQKLRQDVGGYRSKPGSAIRIVRLCWGLQAAARARSFDSSPLICCQQIRRLSHCGAFDRISYRCGSHSRFGRG